MKKFVSLLLLSTMILSLSACGKKEEKIENVITNEPVQEEQIIEDINVEKEEKVEKIVGKEEEKQSKFNDDYIKKINKIYNYDWTPGSLDKLGTGIENKNKVKDLKTVNVITSYDYYDDRHEEFNFLGIDYNINYAYLTKIDDKKVEGELNGLISKKIKEIMAKDLDWKFDNDDFDDYTREHNIYLNSNVWGNVISFYFTSNAYMQLEDNGNYDFVTVDESSSFFTYDLKNKRIMKLSDLFYNDVKYIELINKEIESFVSSESILFENIYYMEQKRPFIGIPENYDGFYVTPGYLMINFGNDNPYYQFPLTIPINYYTYQNEICIEDSKTEDYLRTDELDNIYVFESPIERDFKKITPYLYNGELIVNRIKSGLKSDVVKKINKELDNVEKIFNKENITKDNDLFGEEFKEKEYYVEMYNDMLSNEKTTLFIYNYSLIHSGKDESGEETYDVVYFINQNLVFDNKTGERLKVSDLFDEDELNLIKSKLKTEFDLDDEKLKQIDDMKNFFYNENYNISFEFGDGEYYGLELSEIR